MTTEAITLLETLAERRAFLRQTVAGLTDDQARLRPTVSALTLGGLIKHVAATEAAWAGFVDGGAAGMDAATGGGWAGAFEMGSNETLAGLLDRYADVAARTEALVVRIGDLDLDHRLPDAPWFPPDARWSVRRVLLHLIGETAQHSGHADIIRETIDGAKTMG